jgi:hypothetical protein
MGSGNDASGYYRESQILQGISMARPRIQLCYLTLTATEQKVRGCLENGNLTLAEIRSVLGFSKNHYWLIKVAMEKIKLLQEIESDSLRFGVSSLSKARGYIRMEGTK